jgi:hypothetical protein
MRKKRKLCAVLMRAAGDLLPTSLPGTPSIADPPGAAREV